MTLAPDQQEIEVRDVVADSRLMVAGEQTPVRFEAHAQMAVTSGDPAIEIVRQPAEPNVESGVEPDVESDVESGAVPLARYVARPVSGGWPAGSRLSVRLKGRVGQALHSESENYALGVARTSGIVSSDGVVLSGLSHWLPRFDDELFTFALTVHLPQGWDAVSQGRRSVPTTGQVSQVNQVTWTSMHPGEEVYLIAGPLTRSKFDGADPIATYVYLRRPDTELAKRYADATAHYVKLFSELLGPYPYGKFAMVENFWETGYGMPSFTLLGSRVIRLPFILHSSYPHEILHNWWGNGVYVDGDDGNWCEGLTAYLADHLIKEQRGAGADYRRDTLDKYASYVRTETDMPLSEFRSRHSSASQAIGYGKALMLFHMVRQFVGDEAFIAGLRRFYTDHRFRRASYSDLAAAFSAASGRDLSPVFAQWVSRPGAPALRVQAERLGERRVAVQLKQSGPGEPFHLRVPVAVTVAGADTAHLVTLELDAARKRFELDLPGAPLRVDVDPYFDVFRRLAPGETPPVLGDVFGAAKVLIIAPDARDPLASAWRELARAWSGAGHVRVVGEGELRQLPADHAVWVLGADNAWAPKDLDAGALGPAERYPEGRSAVLMARHPATPSLSLGWITSSSAAAIPGLARKLPHYGKYSYLGFNGAAPTNVAKGQWPVADSPMAAILAPGSAPAALPDRRALVNVR